ncbi:small ribosomal subunit Rsm22 family protein, partial [bacterium]|nr:small ribosomal subunit Rsm22 family protein [bacterium]
KAMAHKPPFIGKQPAPMAQAPKAQAPQPPAPKIPTLQSFAINDDTLAALAALPALLDDALPLAQKHRQELGHTIRSLWEDLTSEKEHRASEYLGTPAYYSAYARYFLPWNIIRLSSIFSSLPLALADGASIADFGSGPLTIPIALYLARPDLRAKSLTLYCVDRTERVLEIGQTIFESLAVKLSGALPPWKLVPLRQQFGDHLPERVDLLAEANMFNEFFWKSKAPLGVRATMTARQLLGYLKDSGSVFLMEPGDPRSGSFISAVRAALISFGASPVAPCPHESSCPMPGIFNSLSAPGWDAPSGSSPLPEVVMPKRREKYPWCHFTIGAEAAPAWLKALSDEAGLSKEKLVFSYLLSAIPEGTPLARKPQTDRSLLRVVSEAFPLPGGKEGRYGCSAEGYSLVSYTPSSAAFASGDLIRRPGGAGAAPSLPRSAAPIAKPFQEKQRGGRDRDRGYGREGDREREGFDRRASGQRDGRKPASRHHEEKRQPSPDKGKDLDEKSGGIIVSY